MDDAGRHRLPISRHNLSMQVRIGLQIPISLLDISPALFTRGARVSAFAQALRSGGQT